MESLVIKWWLGIDGLVVVLPASALVFFGMQEVDAGSFNQQPRTIFLATCQWMNKKSGGANLGMTNWCQKNAILRLCSDSLNRLVVPRFIN